jgi:KTSC domain
METLESKAFIGNNRYLSHTFKQSKTLAYCKYDTVLSLLLVIFHNGTEYEYSGVDSTTYEELITAPSAGSYFSKILRKYKFVRLK